MNSKFIDALPLPPPQTDGADRQGLGVGLSYSKYSCKIISHQFKALLFHQK